VAADEHQHEAGEPTPAAPASGRPDRGFAARQAALLVLRGVRAHETFDTALTSATAALSDPDRRLVHEIAAGVLRGRDALDALLVPRVTGDWRRVSEDLRDVLRIGAYQIHHLTRVPVHAAVAATVEVAKRAHGARSAGFANAVLRRLAQEAAQGVSAAPAPPTATDPRTLARRYSHPAWLVTRWVARFGAERTEALLVHNAARSAVHLQPARWPIERLREAFEAAAIPFTEVEGLPGVAVRGVRVHDLPGYAEGAFVVQDPAQALALEHIALPEGVMIWDACAAPGGKAARLAARGPVLASDPRRARLPRLVDTVRRAAPDVWIVCADALAAPLRAATLDAVLLDVPCSATGTIAKHPDARWHLSAKRIERLAQLQATLLDAVATVVRPGGVLAYLTCSLEQEENDGQVDAFLARHGDYRRSRDDLFLFPADRGTDGAFAARLERAA
jgi:16S rRNA (cytosine967-C5)-methyltransferase